MFESDLNDGKVTHRNLVVSFHTEWDVIGLQDDICTIQQEGKILKTYSGFTLNTELLLEEVSFSVEDMVRTAGESFYRIFKL